MLDGTDVLRPGRSASATNRAAVEIPHSMNSRPTSAPLIRVGGALPVIGLSRCGRARPTPLMWPTARCPRARCPSSTEGPLLRPLSGCGGGPASPCADETASAPPELRHTRWGSADRCRASMGTRPFPDVPRVLRAPRPGAHGCGARSARRPSLGARKAGTCLESVRHPPGCGSTTVTPGAGGIVRHG